MACPPVGFYVPLQGPSSVNHGLSPLIRDERAGRFRGAVSSRPDLLQQAWTAASLSGELREEPSRWGTRASVPDVSPTGREA